MDIMQTQNQTETWAMKKASQQSGADGTDDGEMDVRNVAEG